jgi:outer membrane lipoprotein-sorting protein
MYRRESYSDGKTLSNVQWVLPDGDGLIMTEVSHASRCWFEKRNEAYGFAENPVEYLRERVKSLLDKADREIAEREFDGHPCVGFEIDAYKYGDYQTGRFDRIWFDQETRLPVRMERNGYPLSGDKERTHSLISDQYEYLAELPESLFKPEIPEGYINAEPDEIRSRKKREEKLEPPAAWKEDIYVKLDREELLVCRQQTVIVDASGVASHDSGWALYSESRNRVRIDLHDQAGRLLSTRWILADEDPVRDVTVSHELECYHEAEETLQGYNPRKNLKDYVQYMSDYANLDLGEDVVDEKPCIGFKYTSESHGDKSGRRFDLIWYERETKLPVRFEMRGMRQDRSGESWDMICSYQYFDEVPKGLFEIVIPDRYIEAHPDEVRKKRKK